MPIYEYAPVEDGCDHCSGGFEVFQSMEEGRLSQCPECGGAVEKKISSFGKGRDDMLSDRNLKEHGFSKLRKTNDGTYEQEV